MLGLTIASGPVAVDVTAAAKFKKTPVKFVDMRDARTVEGEFLYTPKTAKIGAGTRVTWRNPSSQPHTVTDPAKKPAFDSGLQDLIETGEKWSFVFRKAGKYNYYCIVHPDMIGRVLVTR